MKRTIDIALGAFLLCASAPVIAVAAVSVALESGRPVFFAQQRAGRMGRPITIYKLRTMHRNDHDPRSLGQVTLDHPLVTRTGRILRRFRIDELPQLLSVIRGDLSLVGPRPALLEQAEEYTSFERRRLAVRPGLTGWAQVNGNTALPWETRILLDVWYVEHLSVGLDLRILARTPVTILRGERVAATAIEEALSP